MTDREAEERGGFFASKYTRKTITYHSFLSSKNREPLKEFKTHSFEDRRKPRSSLV